MMSELRNPLLILAALMALTVCILFMDAGSPVSLFMACAAVVILLALLPGVLNWREMGRRLRLRRYQINAPDASISVMILFQELLNRSFALVRIESLTLDHAETGGNKIYKLRLRAGGDVITAFGGLTAEGRADHVSLPTLVITGDGLVRFKSVGQQSGRSLSEAAPAI